MICLISFIFSSLQYVLKIHTVQTICYQCDSWNISLILISIKQCWVAWNFFKDSGKGWKWLFVESYFQQKMWASAKLWNQIMYLTNWINKQSWEKTVDLLSARRSSMWKWQLIPSCLPLLFLTNNFIIVYVCRACMTY